MAKTTSYTNCLITSVPRALPNQLLFPDEKVDSDCVGFRSVRLALRPIRGPVSDSKCLDIADWRTVDQNDMRIDALFVADIGKVVCRQLFARRCRPLPAHNVVRC